MTTRILVVDDEPSIRQLVSRIFEREGYEVLCAASGHDALRAATSEKFDLVILDLNLPDIPGEEVCQELRQKSRNDAIPILIMTGKVAEGLSTRCLNGGADDYLEKPFEVDEILAHVRAVLRRTQKTTSDNEVVKMGKITIRVPERMILWGTQHVRPFSPKEFELLLYLVRLAPKVVSKNTLALQIWGSPHAQLNQRTLDVHIRRIRMKLGRSAASCLKTIPSVGFQWVVDAESAATLVASN